jgi:hypothetical protein
MSAPEIVNARSERKRQGAMSSSDEALHDQREWLGITLARIGDAVIPADAQAAVTLLNPVAQSSTGPTGERAVGVLSVAFSPSAPLSATRRKHQPQHLRIPLEPNKAQEEQAAIESLKSIFHPGTADTTVPTSHRNTVIDDSVLRCTARRLKETLAVARSGVLSI